MRVGLDVISTRGRTTGLGVYTSNLIEALRQLRGSDLDLALLGEQYEDGDFNTPRRLLWENLELPKLAKGAGLDLLHIPAFAPPMVSGMKTVTTLHDLIGMLYPNQVGFPSRFYWGKWLPFAVKGADRLIADSEHTRKDIIENLGVPERKVTVIYPSAGEDFSANVDTVLLEQDKQALKIDENYFLFVGTIEPRKNLRRVVEAFAKLPCAGMQGRYQLVIIGSQEFGRGQVFRDLCCECNLNAEDIVFPGYLDREVLKRLYAGARALVFPSLYEGFGMPVLEAMAAGTAVLTSGTSSLPEVAGNAAVIVDPTDVDAIAEGMRQLASDSRLVSDLVEKGFEQLKKFSWKKTAQQTLEVYNSLG